MHEHATPVEGLDLPGLDDEELAAVAAAVWEEQNRRYQREAFPQQIASAIATATGAGVPEDELRAVITAALGEEEQPGMTGTYRSTY